MVQPIKEFQATISQVEQLYNFLKTLTQFCKSEPYCSLEELTAIFPSVKPNQITHLNSRIFDNQMP